MARPVREGMEYFPHDTDAVNDEKIEVLMSLYGTKGYCFYFVLLERIYRNSEYELNISEAETVRILCRKITITEEEFSQILSTALKYGLFDMEEHKTRGVLTSKGIKKRAKRVEDKRFADRKRYEKAKEISEAEMNEGKRRVKERKEKDRNYSLEIENFRQRYQEFIDLVDEYIDILKMTRVSGKIADSILLGVYEQMEKYPVIVVEYAINTIVHNPSLHSKKENYFFGILRNTRADEAAEKLSKINDPKIREEEIRW